MPDSQFQPTNRNIIFIGLDCATFWIVEKLVAGGRMPNLARLMADGSTFRTQCEEPVVSPVVWTSIASAKRPEKHGIKSFHATSNSVRTKRVWDFYLQRGSSVGVMGHFVIWPPQKVSGFMVPDLLALDSQTHPADLSFLRMLTHNKKSGKGSGVRGNLEFAKRARKHGVRASTLIAAGHELLRKRIRRRELLDEQFRIRVVKQQLYADVFCDLYKQHQPQYAYFHNHLIDTSSHIFWKYFEPEKFGDVPKDEVDRYGGYLYQAYEDADKTLGQLMQLADEDTLMVVASDHGAKAAADQTSQWRIPTIKSEALMQALHLETEVSYSNVGFDIMVKPRDDDPRMKSRLKELFASIEIVEDKVPLFELLELDASNIWLRLNNAIDELNQRHIRVNGSQFALDDFVHVSNDRTSGVHDARNAILVLHGKGVRQGFKSKTAADVMDIVPTILALSAMPVGRDMDGTVLTAALENNFAQAHPIQMIDSYDEPNWGQDAEADMETTEELKNQLRALGYL